MKTAWKAAIGAGVTVVAAWVAIPRLQPLTSLVTSTGAMLTTTRAILTETEALQKEVKGVQASLSELQRQEVLMTEQQQLMSETLGQLERQEQLAGGARNLIVAILNTEKGTAEVTLQAAQSGKETMATLQQNANGLRTLAGSAAEIRTTSTVMSGQLDRMISEMETSRDEFAVIGRLKQAPANVIERTANWVHRMIQGAEAFLGKLKGWLGW